MDKLVRAPTYMITKALYLNIEKKYGEFCSWAVWADQGEKPKSNIGDMIVFDIAKNPNLLAQLNPNVIMVGLNFSRNLIKEPFVNFHDSRSQGQDYKIRYAFKNTKYYGAYMTDIIKDFEEKISGKVVQYLKSNRDFEYKNIQLFEQELLDLGAADPLIIAFGTDTYEILNRHFINKLRIIKVPHYSNYISKEDYKDKVGKVLAGI